MASGETVAAVELTSGNWESVVGSASLGLVTFWADWSQRCDRFGPVFDRASGRHSDIVFGTVDIERQKALAARFEISDVPTVMAISNSTVRYSRSGDLTEEHLEELICQARKGRLRATGAMPAFSRSPAAHPGQDLESGFGLAGEEATAAAGGRREAGPVPPAAKMAANLKGGLLASYAISEAFGSVIADQVGGHTLTLSGDRRDAELIGPGPMFNGFQSATATPGFLDTRSDFSVSAWVRLGDTTEWHTAISQDATEVSAFYLQYSAADRTWAFSMPAADSLKAHLARAVAPAVPRAGVWQHLVGVHHAGAGQLRLYADGRLVGAAPFGAGWLAAGSFVIGRGLFGDPADWFVGDIDQIRVWNRALTGAEALALAQPPRHSLA